MTTVTVGVGQDFETLPLAQAGTTTGDTLRIVGDLVAPSSPGETLFNAPRIYEGSPGSRLLPAAGETTYTARTDAALSAANNPLILTGLNIDGLGQTDSSLFFANDPGDVLDIQVVDLTVSNSGANRLIYDTQRSGIVRLHNTRLGSDSTGKWYECANNALAVNKVVHINGLDVNGRTISGGGFIEKFHISKVNSATAVMEGRISGVKGSVRVIGNNTAAVVFVIENCDTAIFENSSFRVDADQEAQSCTGVRIYGGSSSPVSTIRISNVYLEYFAHSGHGIFFGNSGTESYVVAGQTVSGCHVKGKYHASTTPHNISFGQGTDLISNGMVSEMGYVGFLFGVVANHFASDHVAYDCYGPSFYVKGCTNATIQRNVVVQTGAVQQRDNGLIAVTFQDAINTANCTITDNDIIIVEPTKIASVFQKSNSSQVYTCTNNRIYVPDTLDISTWLGFAYESATANMTFAQWESQLENSGNRIIRMPIGPLRELALSYKPVRNTNNPGLFKPLFN